MPSTIRNVDSLVRDAIKVLDHDAYAVSSKTITDEAFISRCLTIIQDDPTAEMSQGALISNPQAPVVAIVDRTANIEQAAKVVTYARCAFGGRSPHAPDIVLVNEFVKKDFIKWCLQHLATITATLTSEASARPSKTTFDQNYPTDSVTTIFESNKVKFLEVTKR